MYTVLFIETLKNTIRYRTYFPTKGTIGKLQTNIALGNDTMHSDKSLFMENCSLEYLNNYVAIIIIRMELSTDAKCLYIYKNISELSKTDVDKIYNIVDQNKKITKQQNNNNIKKVKKYNAVIDKTKSINNKIQPEIVPQKSKTKKAIKCDVSEESYDDGENSNIDEDENALTEEKNEFILKYVNALLKNSGKEEIQDLTEFKNVNRLDIVSEENIQYVKTMMDEITNLFDKINWKYYQETAKSRPLNVLRGMIKDNQTHQLIAINKEVSELLDGKKIRRSAMLYTIANI